MAELAAIYAYVDTALGALNRRNHVQRLGDVNFSDEGPERYITHRRASSALLDWVKDHHNTNGNPTIEGFDGEVWDTSLPFDFDDRNDPANALVWVRQFLQRLEPRDVPLDALRFYFSGAKGFHVEIPHTLFGGFEPSAELHVYERAAAIELMGSIPFDRAVYDKLRLWRLPNTLNVKGQRFKVRLSLQEVLELSMADIALLAEHPRPRMPTAADEEWTSNDYLVEVWARARGLPQTPENLPYSRIAVSLKNTEYGNSEVKPDTRTWSDERGNKVLTAATVAAIAMSWPHTDPTISRHSDYLLPLSGFLARHMDVDTVAALLKDAARAAGDVGFLNDRTRRWEDEIDRLAQGSAQKIANNQPVEGLPTIDKRWPELADFLSTQYLAHRSAEGGSRSSNTDKGFSFATLEAALEEPPEDTAYLVDGLLPRGGVSLWGAKPKVGKSVMVRNLAMSVARGEPFLGHACHQGTVVVLALEEKRAEVINHFRTMGGIDEAVHLHTGAAPGNSKQGLAALAAAITLYQPALVIVDPVFKLVRVKDSSDYAELTRELEPVIELARNNGCHIAVTHHLGKMVRDGGDDVLGSTAIFGAVDTLALMRRRKDQQRTLETIQRYGKDLTEVVVPLDEVSGTVSIGVKVVELKVTEAKDQVRLVLGKFAADYWADSAKVREAAGLDRNMTVRALKELVEEGVAESRGAGKPRDPFQYRLIRSSSNAPNEVDILCIPRITVLPDGLRGEVEGAQVSVFAANTDGQPSEFSEIESFRIPVLPTREANTGIQTLASSGNTENTDHGVVCQHCGRGEELHTPDNPVCTDWKPDRGYRLEQD